MTEARIVPKYFLLSAVLAFIAIGLEVAAKSRDSRAIRTLARAVVLPEGERAAAKMQARSFSTQGTIVSLIGVAFALGSLAFIIPSARKHEPARRSVTVVLLVLYLMLQLLMT